MFLITLLLCAVTVSEGNISKEFIVKKSYDEVVDHIEKDIDDIYKSVGITVVSRKNGEVTAYVDTPQFGKIEWKHTEKIQKDKESISVTIDSKTDKFIFHSSMKIKPHKKGVHVGVDAKMNVNDERATPKLIEIGLSRFVEKIKRHLKTF